MLDVSILFKLAGLGIITLIIVKVMESGGKKEQAFMVELASVVIGLVLVASFIAKLFDSVKTLFQF